MKAKKRTFKWSTWRPLLTALIAAITLFAVFGVVPGFRPCPIAPTLAAMVDGLGGEVPGGAPLGQTLWRLERGDGSAMYHVPCRRGNVRLSRLVIPKGCMRAASLWWTAIRDLTGRDPDGSGAGTVYWRTDDGVEVSLTVGHDFVQIGVIDTLWNWRN